MGRPAVLKVDILADAGKAKRELDDTEGRFSRFGSAAAKAGKIAALGLAAGLGAAVVAGVKLAKSAAEDEAAAAKLANTLHQAAGATDAQVAATERWISKQGAALGVADDELRPALSRLAVATGDVGKAQQLASLAMDVSAGTGKSLEQVSTALAKAQNGQVAGLSRLGIATKDAAGHTITMDQATSALADKFKGAASSAANTTAGQYGRLKLILAETGESIGAKLLPVGTKLASWVLGMVPTVTRLGSDLSQRLGPAFTTVGNFISNRVIPAAREFISWFQERIVPAIRNALTPVLNGARSAFGSVSDAIARNRPQLQGLLSAVRVVVEWVADHLLPVMGKQLGVSFRIAGAVIGGIIDTIGGLSRGIATAVGWVRSLVGWISRIHMPNLGALSSLAGKLGLGSAQLHTVGPQLAGQGVSYDSRRPFATAALGSSTTWSTMAAGQLTGGASVAYVDARSFPVSVDAGGGINDPGLVAQLARLLEEHQQRIGRRPVFG